MQTTRSEKTDVNAPVQGIRVANIIEEARVGGPQVRMVRVAAALKGQAETTILMPREHSEAFVRLCRDADVDFVALPISRITRDWRVALRYVFLFPYEIWCIVRVLRKGQFDLVHVSGGSWQYKGVIAAWLTGIPSVWHLNDTQMPGIIRRIFNLLSPLAAGFIFASHRSWEYYGARLDDRMREVVPSTVDAGHFDPEQELSNGDELLWKICNGPIVGMIANVNPIKGVEILIRAAAIVRGAEPDLKVVIVGPVFSNQEKYHAELVSLARELGVSKHILWAGKRSDVRPLLARFDVYVCSSIAESSPISVWEAMAMARAIVSTDVGDVARHIIDGESGYIIAAGDYEAMAARILELVGDKEKAKRLGSRARAIAVKEFSPARIAELTLSFYEQVIAANAKKQESR